MKEDFKVSETDSIFAIVKLPNKKLSIVVGKMVVTTEQFKTQKEAEKYIASKPYELIINSTIAVLKQYKNEESNKKVVEENPKENV